MDNDGHLVTASLILPRQLECEFFDAPLGRKEGTGCQPYPHKLN
ncbi:hypothetical protein FB459_3166 [Yimella lutea]|uniref:Uncharacterized protein n=1 Tax=Yimella lutea TaxID=587872 RepID=A0A542EJV2_9MICO|nr:hypothetical protein FB459_3166 [Yimella lutea]